MVEFFWRFVFSSVCLIATFEMISMHEKVYHLDVMALSYEYEMGYAGRKSVTFLQLVW